MMNYWINLQGQSVNKNPGKKVLIPSWEYGKDKNYFFWDGIVWKWLKRWDCSALFSIDFN